MNTETFPHRADNVGSIFTVCRCEASIANSALVGETWGSDCPAALREALVAERAIADDYRWQRDAAHDQLADIAALVAGELPPDDREGGDPVLGRAWEAVKALRMALIRECEAHTRCMGERDAALARVVELEATLANERATPPSATELLMRARDAFAASGNGFVSIFSADGHWFAAVTQVRDRRHAAALLRWRGGGAS